METNNEFMGGYDSIEFQENELIGIIDLINELSEEEYLFVLKNNKHSKGKGIAK